MQYIEVRCLDIDPFEPLGISLATARFLDAFLLFCALDDSPLTDEQASAEAAENFARTVKEGRRPGLQLKRQGQPVGLQEWGLELIDHITATASLLDAQYGDTRHADALLQQTAKLRDASLTPSARVLNALSNHSNSFTAFGLAQSREHAHFFAQHPLQEDEEAAFNKAVQTSLDEQAKLEHEQQGDLDAFVAAYNLRTPSRLCGQ